MADGDAIDSATGQVRNLEEQVTAFTGFGEALKEVDGVLGQVSEGLARTGGEVLQTRWTGPREVRAVALA